MTQARQFFQDGLAHSEAGRLEQAERSFAAALSLAPGRPSVLTNLGATLVRRGRWADALELLEEATAAEPDNLQAWSYLAVAHAELVHADVVEHLQSTDHRYDLVLASDVFVYLGALDAVFAGAARVLAPGGSFDFSIERTDDARDLRLLPSLRYAHSQAYVRRLAQEHGFEVRAAFPAPLREDQHHPIEGLYVYLQAR